MAEVCCVVSCVLERCRLTRPWYSRQSPAFGSRQRCSTNCHVRRSPADSINNLSLTGSIIHNGNRASVAIEHLAGIDIPVTQKITPGFIVSQCE